MNILVLGWRGPKHPNAGGAEQVVHEHCKGWIEAGHSVTLFTSHFTGSEEKEIIDGVEVIRKSFQYWGVQISAFFWYVFKKHNKFDLVIDQFHGIPFFTPLYFRSTKLALIQEIAGKVWLKNDLPFPFNWIIGLIGYIGEPFMFLFYKNTPFMTGSKSTKIQLIKVGIPSENIYIVNHGVIVKKPKKIINKEKVKTIIYLGAITHDKGIGDVLKTFSILSKLGNYKFWIIGKASEYYKKYIEKMVNNLDISKNTNYFGFVDQKTKFTLLAKAHVLINPSILEGWGLVNIEANAVGTPVIAYKSPGLVDSVKDGQSGIICKINTPESMAGEVSSLLEDNQLYTKLQKGATVWSKQFSWKKSKQESLILIDKVVSGNI